jgi:hypothetical protein
LRFGIKISKRDVTALFRKAFNLKISSSSIDGFMDQLKEEAKYIYDELLESLKQSPFIHADETGHPIDGIGHWLWKLSNKKICYSHIDKGRGQAVLEKILGDKYDGVLISDFLSAYNKMKLSGLKPGASIRLLRNLSEAENPLMLRFSPLQPAHSSPGLKAWGFLRRRIKIGTVPAYA